MSLCEKNDRFYASGSIGGAFPTLNSDRWPRDRLEAILAVPGGGDTLLDIGCGEGAILYYMRERFRNLIGLEYSPVRLEKARVNLAAFGFRGICGSAEDMTSLESESVDRIVTADVIEHIPDVYAATSEMYRVLKRAGVVVINTPNIAFLKKRVLLAVGRFPSTAQPNEGLGDDLMFDGGHLHYFTFRSLRLLLERAGFKVVRKLGFGRLGRVHDFWPECLSGGAQWIAEKP